MPEFAQVIDDVSFTPGDGVAQPIPRGRVEVALADDSATLSWEAEKGVAAVAAIPRVLFEEHVQAGRIVWSAPEASPTQPIPASSAGTPSPPDPASPGRGAAPGGGG